MSDAPLRAIRWRKAADDDLAEIVDFIAAENTLAAERLLDQF